MAEIARWMVSPEDCERCEGEPVALGCAFCYSGKNRKRWFIGDVEFDVVLDPTMEKDKVELRSR